MLTGETITDEQIRELRDSRPDDTFVALLTAHALGDMSDRRWPGAVDIGVPSHHDVSHIATCRARCAEILNARSGKP
jgi:hypothetical protein